MGITDRLKQLATIGVASVVLTDVTAAEAKPLPKEAVTAQATTPKRMTAEELDEFMKTREFQKFRDDMIVKWLPMAESVSEGYYAYGYKDSSGYPTIGIGTCFSTCGLALDDIPIRYKPDVNGGRELTLEEKQAYVRAIQNNRRQKKESDYKAGKRLADQMGIYGLTKNDAMRVAVWESRSKVDEIYKRVYLEKKVDLRTEPIPVRVLALDIGYQVGTGGLMKFKKFWKNIANKDYDLLKGNVRVNEGRAHNVARHETKVILAQLANAQHKGEDTTKLQEDLNKKIHLDKFTFRMVTNPKSRLVIRAVPPDMKIQQKSLIQRLIELEEKRIKAQKATDAAKEVKVTEPVTSQKEKAISQNQGTPKQGKNVRRSKKTLNKNQNIIQKKRRSGSR